MAAAAATPPSPLPKSGGFGRSWLLLTNATMMIGWARTLRVVFRNYNVLTTVADSTICVGMLTEFTKLAVILSFLEVGNAGMGFTRSKPHQVLLFAVVRAGVELLVAPMLPCGSWQHLLTVTCWALGDTVRFGCFVVDNLVPGGSLAKSVRYTAGPLLFPIGAGGEMMMVIAAAADGRPYLFAAAALWPIFFYPLMKQLLKQRKKHFAKQKTPVKRVKAV